MQILTLDFETFWDATYTLSKMTCEEYVRDPRFKAHMVGLKIGDEKTIILNPQQLRIYLPTLPWQRLALLCQNTQFDGFILAHHFNIFPALYLDTMSMFRAVRPDKRASLASISDALGLSQAKGGAKNYSITNTKGVRDLPAEQWSACAEYCKLDCDLTYEAFQKLKPGFPPEEIRLIDQTLRYFTQPVLVLNPEPLQAEVIFEAEKKAELVQRIGGDVKVLGSAPKFAALLESLGVIPPVKPSPTALKKDPDLRDILEELDLPQEAYTPALLTEAGIPWSYAFGKNDKGLLALQQHDDPLVVASVEARLGIKSTLAGTRASRLLSASQRGPYPVSINYAAAHTLRDGGSGGCNVQNLPGNKPGQSTRLRESFTAPAEHSLVVCDLASIEARVLAYLAGEEAVLSVFRGGGDLYCDMASTVFQRQITKADKTERQIGKVLILSCIAEGELVLTDRGLIPIQEITIGMRVWDGVEWVQHEGVIDRGEKEVMFYAGLTATPDHQVYLQDGSIQDLQSAAAAYSRLARTGYDRYPLSFVGDHQRQDPNSRPRQDSLIIQPSRQIGKTFRAALGRERLQPPPEGTDDSDRILYPNIRDTRSFKAVRKTYDILNAGPRHRFTVSGVLVHNCGYSMSWKKFQENMYLVNKTLFDAEIADTLGVSLGPVLAKHSRYLSLAKPQTLTADQFVLHCAVSEFLVKAYRDKYPSITRFWRTCITALDFMISDNEFTLDPNGVVKTFHTGFQAPWGLPLRYIDLQSKVKKGGKQIQWSRASKEGRSHLHPGLVAENVVQWLSRHIMKYQSLILQAEGLKIAFPCHDEIVGVVREADAPYWEHRMHEVMSAPIPWLPGLPLGAEAHTGKTYWEAK